MTWQTRFYQYALLVRLHRPVGIFLLLWPTLWALWFAAQGVPHWLNLAVFAGGVVLMRSAGCAINDYADRDFDPQVTRTQERPVAAGKVRPREAIAIFVILSLCAFGLVWLLNLPTIKLSVGGALLAALYPFTKRYTYLPQIFLGAAFGWAVPMAYAAETGSVPPTAWLLFVVTVLWATVYDTQYAMVDRREDLRIGVKSTAILFGDLDRMIIGILQLMVILGLYAVGMQTGRGVFYVTGLAVATGLGLYQQYLIKDRNEARCFQAFINNAWFGAAVFVGLAADYLWLPATVVTSH
ncbi:MAG: 4-hydroxybenzoate octaprenyltransferase [Pseudomonadota bacterium]